MNEISKSHTLSEQLDSAADNLKWCLSEKYHAEKGADYVVRGHNEVVSLYCRPQGCQVVKLAAELERVVAPVRTANAIKLLDQIDALSVSIRQSIAEESQ